MNTLHFKYVAEVAKTGSITQAAENLFMAQPNLSKAIKELEETLGISIFRRTSKGVVLTEKGEEFLVYAKRVLTQIGRMESLAGQDSFTRKRMSFCMPAATYISYAFSKFARSVAHEAGVEIRMKEADFVQGANLISDGETAFGFLRVPGEYLQYFQGFLEEKGLCFQQIWQGEYLVTVSSTHALAKAGEITDARLCDFLEVAEEEAPLPTLPGAEPIPEKTVGRKITLQGGGEIPRLLGNLENGYWWASPMPGQMLAEYGLVQRSCMGTARKFCDLLVYPKDYTLTAMDRKFIDMVSITKNEVSLGSY